MFTINKPIIRPFYYILNSKIDFIDFISVLILLSTGIILLLSKPLEYLSLYTSLTKDGITSQDLGAFALVVSTINLIRLFSPKKIFCIYSTVLLKCLMLMFFFLMLFTVIGNSVLPLTTGYLLVVCLISLDNIRRT